jgi:hypothetical protein
MAEPLSAVGSILGLVDVAARTSSQILQLIKEWKNAPDQVHFLYEEIKMSRQVAQQLQMLCEPPKGQALHNFSTFAEAISTQIIRAEPVWKELEQIVYSIRGPVKTKVRNARWMRKCQQVASLQSKLHKIRFTTLEILSSHNV